ncbi:Trimethylguanosine synthase [Taenia crassiceps]|uniref:Trimethylguanosine synthase n=1 Tax=Taenia crassiceps TaxID=6207 RepID=A0ABR4QKV7_9CEST
MHSTGLGADWGLKARKFEPYREVGQLDAMAFDMNHVKELVCITYPSVLNKLPTRICFTRAFFADCFKGMPTESCEPVGDKQSSPSPLVAENVLEDRKLYPAFSKSSTSVRDRSVKVSPKYYTSLAYTLSVLRKDGSDSDDSDSESSSSLSLQRKQDHRPACVIPHMQVSKSSPRLEGQGDIESVLEEMRMLGLPTSFGRSKSSRIRTVATRRHKEQDQSTTDLDALFLNALENDKGSQWLTHSLTDICKAASLPLIPHGGYDDSPTSEVPCIFAAICRVLGYGFCPNQPWSQLPRILYFRLPDSWNKASPRSVKCAIQSSLSSGRRCIFRYKPPSAASSRKYVNQKPPPEHLYEDGETASSLKKYWAQRYRLFSRFDSDIQFDREGLFSVTPEVIAVHHARRLANILGGPPSSHTVLDLFTGIGGNCIQLAVVGFNVVTVDISESMLQMAKANARVYGVHKRITFVRADAFAFLRETRQRFSAALASPPWGGPTYSSSTVFSLSCLTFSGGGETCSSFFNLLEAIASVTTSGGPVALFLPRNTNAGQLFELHRRFMDAALVDVIPQLECELALIHGKPKGLTVYLYYGEGLEDEEEESIVSFESLSESTVDSSTFYDCD